jgi:hypothetical protein
LQTTKSATTGGTSKTERKSGERRILKSQGGVNSWY